MAGKNFVILKHPLIEDYVTRIRDRKTSFIDFRYYVDKLSFMLAYETAKELSLKSRSVKTPLSGFNGKEISDNIVLIPILRAGLGLLNGFTQVFPNAMVSHIGIYRNEETLEPVKYYFKFPRLKSKKNAIVYILDPMLATGGSADCTVREVKKIGIKKIIIASLVSAPEGIKQITKNHKDVRIYTCAVDKKLNKKGYIVPGLGDAGDRLFGT
jgi:uracil phosphoribosyltransferase